MARFFFTRRSGVEGAQRDASRRIADVVRVRLALDETTTVSVTELACGDPGCVGGAETVILVMRPGRPTAAAKVLKAMAQTTDDDVATALATLVEEPRSG